MGRNIDSVVMTERPRNVDAKRAGAILYGDLGTSKAYVIGLAFAVAGYSSFWLILAVSILLILVGLNYVVICRCYPFGGGVYTSVRQRSQILSLVAGFFLIADFIVTAALSAQSAFSYFHVETPAIWTACIMALIGAFNYFGPRSTGKHAFYIFIFAFVCLVFLAIFSIPHLGDAVRQLQNPPKNFMENWKNFVSVIVALSGIEVIANMTGIMKLDKGTTRKHPQVTMTAKKAIFWVITEVVLFTSFFSLASMALKGITIADGQVFSPDNIPIRDAWLRYLGETFASQIFGDHAGLIFGWILSIAIAILLFSAVNTALTGLISILYVISNDGELPRSFQKLNRMGVPIWPLIIATIAPMIIVLVIHDIAGLAHLYAIGFIGAIATNLIATSSDRRLPVKPYERGLMIVTFIILFFIEITLFIDKPEARNFILLIVLCGLILRGLTQEAKERKKTPHPRLPPASGETFAILCVVQNPSDAINYAIKRAEEKLASLYFLFIREQHVIFETDAHTKWEDDEQAKQLFETIKKQTSLPDIHFYYAVTDYPPETILHYAEIFNANEVILSVGVRHSMVNLIYENQNRELRKLLPSNIPLLIIPETT